MTDAATCLEAMTGRKRGAADDGVQRQLKQNPATNHEVIVGSTSTSKNGRSISTVGADSSPSTNSSSEDDDPEPSSANSRILIALSQAAGPRFAEKSLLRAHEQQQPLRTTSNRTLRKPRAASATRSHEDGEHESSSTTSGAAKRGRRETLPDIAKRIPVDALRPFLRVSLVTAAKALSISATTLKRLCRHYGIKRWPYRQISGIDRTVHRLEEELQASLRRSPSTSVRDPIVAHIRELQLHRQGMVELALEGGHEPIRGKLASVGTFVDNVRGHRETVPPDPVHPPSTVYEAPMRGRYSAHTSPCATDTNFAGHASEYTQHDRAPQYQNPGGNLPFVSFQVPVASHVGHPTRTDPETPPVHTDRITPPPPSPSLAAAVAAAAAAVAVESEAAAAAAAAAVTVESEDGSARPGNAVLPVTHAAPDRAGEGSEFGSQAATPSAALAPIRSGWSRSYRHSSSFLAPRVGPADSTKALLRSQSCTHPWEDGTSREWSMGSSTAHEAHHQATFQLSPPPPRCSYQHSHTQHGLLAAANWSEASSASNSNFSLHQHQHQHQQQDFGVAQSIAGGESARDGRVPGHLRGGSTGGSSIDMTVEDVHALGELVFGNPENYAAATAAHASCYSASGYMGGNTGFCGGAAGAANVVNTGVDVAGWSGCAEETSQSTVMTRRDAPEWGNNRGCLV